MDYIWLRIKVFILHILIRLKLKKNLWYKCELDLAKYQGKKWAKLFEGDE